MVHGHVCVCWVKSNIADRRSALNLCSEYDVGVCLRLILEDVNESVKKQ